MLSNALPFKAITPLPASVLRLLYVQVPQWLVQRTPRFVPGQNPSPLPSLTNPLSSSGNHSSTVYAQLTSQPPPRARPRLDVFLKPSQSVLFLLVKVTVSGTPPDPSQASQTWDRGALSPGGASFTECTGSAGEQIQQGGKQDRDEGDINCCRHSPSQGWGQLTQPLSCTSQCGLVLTLSQSEVGSLARSWKSSNAPGSSETDGQGKTSPYIRLPHCLLWGLDHL